MEDKDLEMLAAHGVKLTNQRKTILKVFRESEKHLLTAQEVYAKLSSGAYPSMNFSTVYRNLEMLTEKNILNRIVIDKGVSGFELKQSGHHHHMICKSCGKVKLIDFCPLEALQKDFGEDFEPIDHKFEIYGYCSVCKDTE